MAYLDKGCPFPYNDRMNSCARLFLHIVWATWDRLPLITPDIQSALCECIAQKCRDNHAIPLAIVGVADHVHVLVRVPVTVSIPRLVHDLKGASSHLVTHHLKPEGFFKWQGSYGVYSVSPEGVPAVTEYILRQADHHANSTTDGEWERSKE